MRKPPFGVSPMLVSMLTPSRTAVRLAPLPRCAITADARAVLHVASVPRRTRTTVRGIHSAAHRVPRGLVATRTIGPQAASTDERRYRSRQPAEQWEAMRKAPRAHRAPAADAAAPAARAS